jgi:AraC-like DNA-binding protein
MDVLADVLATVRFQAALSGSLRVAAPWALAGAVDGHAHFYLIVEGGAQLVLPARRPRPLGVGDVVLLAAGTAHTLRDGGGGRGRPRVMSWPDAGSAEVGGPGPVTRLISSCLLIEDAERTPLWSALPDVLHVPGARARELAPLAAAARLLADDAVTGGPGGDAIGLRLADILVIEMIREHLRNAGAELVGWLGGLGDPRLSPALAAMHRAPATPWTVDQLARLSAMSRTSFATRFSAQIGRGPLDYLRILRLQRAAHLLRTDVGASIAEVATRVGYDSEAGFRRAFNRWATVSPASYRRRTRGTVSRTPRDGARRGGDLR